MLEALKSATIVIVLIPIVAVVYYAFVRIGTMAYFKSKRDYLSRIPQKRNRHAQAEK
jgi:hypothetical protein